jgi:membrane protease YdiL (CAAX protease family)
MRVAARLGAVALVLVALAAFVPFTHPHPGAGPQSASYVTPMAALDIGGLFGDENEPDENEADEGSPQRAPANDHGSGVALPWVIALVALAGALGGYVYIRVRRAYLRFRAWGRRMWARL